ncbi:MAG: beta-propeller fold lactonase family protein, partial [Candidatus Eremiobacterota bacterium]
MTVRLVDNSNLSTIRGNGPVLLALNDPTGQAAFSGNRVATMVDGVAIFEDLAIDLPGTYSINAAFENLRGSSGPIRVNAASPPGGLVFTVQPPNGVPNRPLDPAVQVTAVDRFGQTAIDATGVVQLTLVNERDFPVALTTDEPVISGNRAPLVNGVAVFSDLRILQPGQGVYRLVPFLGDLVSPSSNAFTVSPVAIPSSLRFLAPGPQDGLPGAVLNPVSVEVLDQFGARFSSATNPITLTLTVPGGALLSGGTPASAAGGVATFANLTVDQAGTYSLTATSPGLAAAISGDFRIGAPAALLLAYVVQSVSNDIVAFSRDPATGALTSLGAATASGGLTPTRLRRNLDGRFLFVLHSGAGNLLRRFGVDPVTGGLSNPRDWIVGNLPTDLTMNPAGNLLYVVNRNDNNISGFTLDGNGDLAATPASPYAAGGTLFGTPRLGIDATGRFAFLSSNGAFIYQKNILLDGQMVPTVPPSSVIVVNSVEVSCHPTLAVAYVCGTGGDVAGTTIDGAGDLVEPPN